MMDDLFVGFFLLSRLLIEFRPEIDLRLIDHRYRWMRDEMRWDGWLKLDEWIDGWTDQSMIISSIRYSFDQIGKIDMLQGTRIGRFSW